MEIPLTGIVTCRVHLFFRRNMALLFAAGRRIVDEVLLPVALGVSAMRRGFGVACDGPRSASDRLVID